MSIIREQEHQDICLFRQFLGSENLQAVGSGLSPARAASGPQPHPDFEPGIPEVQGLRPSLIPIP